MGAVAVAKGLIGAGAAVGPSSMASGATSAAGVGSGSRARQVASSSVPESGDQGMPIVDV